MLSTYDTNYHHLRNFDIKDIVEVGVAAVTSLTLTTMPAVTSVALTAMMTTLVSTSDDLALMAVS